ncbi:XRE family transcriptional regulator [Algoriphagus sp.]|uniref:XRE family transcriptional regulator n=1 Tax=Algoriphagus sp. TaxID=1872435 RepID=UPI002727CBFA|nr:XRE family transcriptional regulator [Algoriphagus sp.]MDO8965060.1 XRE family transcriptional regulator [Algoriphagus sp.]MDP3201869.1 XRE family transcriptional regulator [Algoriphagus sp.]
MNEKIHHGRNIKRFREMMGIKQEALAHELGEDWSQKKISLLEQKEEVEEELLRQVAEILKVPVEAIKSFNEETAINFFNSSFNGQFSGVNYHTTFNVNPIEKWVEALEENKKLYERLLESEKEKVEMLKRMLEK